MKKNAFISTLACFLFISTLSSRTHAFYLNDDELNVLELITDVEINAVTEHVAGVVTGYTGSTVGHGAPTYPNVQYNTVAVHQKSSTNSAPLFPFGTTFLMKDNLYVEGYGYKAIFKVTDTGDLARKRDLYWFDVYFGTSTPTNINNAIEFGIKNKNVAYTAY